MEYFVILCYPFITGIAVPSKAKGVLILGNIHTIYTAECPYTNKYKSITIDYAVIHIAGKLSPEYKKMSYKCDLIHECPYPDQDEYGRCPLYISSPSQPK